MRAARKKAKAENPEAEMSLSGHLKELRNRLGICLVVLVVAMVAALSKAADLVEILLELGRDKGYEFIYIAPQELLMEYVSISLVVGICVTLPILFYQIWAFVRPGLKKRENFFFVFAMVFGFICFCIGLVFAWEIMLPFMLNFLSSLSGGNDVEAAISVQKYISFLLTIFIVFGVLFELPMVTSLLAQLGLMKKEWMKKARRPAIVVIFFVAALVTPPDVVSQAMVAIPVIGLYELSIVLCGVFERFRKKEPEEGEEEEDTESAEDDE